MNETTPPKPSPWAWLWDRRKAIGAAMGGLLLLLCPILPPQAQLPCQAAKSVVQLVTTVAGGGDPSASSSSSSSTSSPAGCAENTTQSLPHFCKCVDGGWRDYFDVDAGCPED